MNFWISGPLLSDISLLPSAIRYFSSVSPSLSEGASWDFILWMDIRSESGGGRSGGDVIAASGERQDGSPRDSLAGGV